MRHFLLIISFLSLLRCGGVDSRLEPIDQFSARLKDIIVKNDLARLKEIPCLPEECEWQDKVSAMSYRDENGYSVRSILSRPSIKMSVFGPHSISDESSETYYTILFFDAENITLDSAGYLSQDIRKRYWWKHYVETVVTSDDKGWGFSMTPFYFGAHLPWAEDY